MNRPSSTHSKQYSIGKLRHGITRSSKVRHVSKQTYLGRLATARQGSKTALTRRQRQTTTDAQHQECTGECERTHPLRVCETCAITVLAICNACTDRGPHEKWCRTCIKHELSMCTRCRANIRRACNRCKQTKLNMTHYTVASTHDARGTGDKTSTDRQDTSRHSTDNTQHNATEPDAPQTNADQHGAGNSATPTAESQYTIRPAKGNLGKWPLIRDAQLAIAQQLQHIIRIPTGADRLYPRRTQGTQSILPYHALTSQAPTQQDTHTQAMRMEAAARTSDWKRGNGTSRTTGETGTHTKTEPAGRLCRRRRKRGRPGNGGDRGDVGDSRREKAAKGHTAAGHNRRRRSTDEEEQRDGQDRKRRIHEENMGQYMANRQTAVTVDDSEPHMAAHTTMTAHLAKRAEKHERVLMRTADDDKGPGEKETRKPRRHQTLLNYRSRTKWCREPLLPQLRTSG